MQIEQTTNNNTPPTKSDRVRELNDRLRIHGRGGMVLISNGLAAYDGDTVQTVFRALASFAAFNSANDPWGEHDCAIVEVEGLSILWKIDYYDEAREMHSPDPADPNVTCRVMTVMLAEEY